MKDDKEPKSSDSGEPMSLEDKVVYLLVASFMIPGIAYFFLTIFSVVFTPIIHNRDTGHVDLNVSQFTESFEPASRNVTIRGRALSGAVVKRAYLYQNQRRYSYSFPLVPESWSKGDPVWVVVEIHSPSEDLSLEAVRAVKGVVRNVLFEGLPSETRKSLKDQGVVLASGAVYVTGSISDP